MFDAIERARLHDIHFRSDEASGLRAIIAIHSTRLGPALGGCRCLPYNSDEDAIADAVRLARGMSYKAALAGVPQGGGKSVILEPEEDYDRVALYAAFGQFIHEMGGRYISAVDSGSHITDMDVVAQQTPYVSGTSRDGLDPSPMTAMGVFAGIQSAVSHQLKRNDLKDVKVAIQGVGNVGYALAGLLHRAGAKLTVCDVSVERVQRCVHEFGADAVSPEAIYRVDCDVFAPCGLGGSLNHETVPLLRCAVVAGSANNQLQEDAQGQELHRLGILYAPDYVINAGGLITVSLGYHKVPQGEIWLRTKALGETLTGLFSRSRAEGRPPEDIANHIAEDILYS